MRRLQKLVFRACTCTTLDASPALVGALLPFLFFVLTAGFPLLFLNGKTWTYSMGSDFGVPWRFAPANMVVVAPGI